MGWFEEQIRQRKKADDAAFSDTFQQIADSLIGTRLSRALNNKRIRTKNCIDEILKYYHLTPKEDIPEEMTDINDQLDYVLRPFGIMYRVVKLPKKWYRDAIGPMMSAKKDTDEPIALIPTGLSGYSYYDPEEEKLVKIRRWNADKIADEGICFYKPLPLKKIGIPQLIGYMLEHLSVADFVLAAAATLLVTLIGLLEPNILSYIYGPILEVKSQPLLWAASIFLLSVIVGKLLIQAVGTLLNSRVMTRIDINVVAATMMRILAMPSKFFKQFSAGELYSRTQGISQLCSMMISTIMGAGITSIFSLVYVSQIMEFAPALLIPSSLVLLATLAVTILTAVYQQRIAKRSMEVSAKESGILYSTLTGIQKIKVAGAEKRAFSKWGSLLAEETKLQYNPSKFLVLNGVITTAITLIGEMFVMYSALASKITLSNFMAFNASFGVVSGAFLTLASSAISIAQIRPVLEMVKPILETEPEISEDKKNLKTITGSVELNNVSFRYEEGQQNIIDNLTLKIKKGEYIAICGSTGCGKSTLIRLMTGFEKPQRGAVYYDGKDLNSIDLRSLRKNIGFVMQDGKLFHGDIYSNIVISAPQLTMDDAWEAAEIAGIADSIRQMPMGMYTILSEGSGGISGGQRQRLMIARAVAPKPKILILDEATSALDNITQKQVTESLDSLKCTRIVVAHRLSTIRQCDRIIVLDKGHIIEDGTYTELIKKKGFFAELVKRQQVEQESAEKTPKKADGGNNGNRKKRK